MIGARAEEVDTGMPVAQLVTRSESESPKSPQQPRGLQIDAHQIKATTFKLSAQEERDIRPEIYIARITIGT
jgi:hypothetical protein